MNVKFCFHDNDLLKLTSRALDSDQLLVHLKSPENSMYSTYGIIVPSVTLNNDIQ